MLLSAQGGSARAWYDWREGDDRAATARTDIRDRDQQATARTETRDRDQQMTDRTGERDPYMRRSAGAYGTGTLAGTSRQEGAKTQRLSELVGQEVYLDDRQQVGEVKDILIDVREGRVAYAIISLDETEGMQARNTIVPWQSMELQPAATRLVIKADRNQLDQMAFSGDAQPDLQDRTVVENLHRSFNVQPYSEVYGYVPADSAPDAQRDQDFDPRNLQSYTGTVRSVEDLQLGASDESGRILTIETEDGQSHTVHVGPSKWYGQDKAELKAGDKVTIVGSSATVENRQIIFAGSISSEDGATSRDQRAIDGNRPETRDNQQQDTGAPATR